MKIYLPVAAMSLRPQVVQEGERRSWRHLRDVAKNVLPFRIDLQLTTLLLSRRITTIRTKKPFGHWLLYL